MPCNFGQIENLGLNSVQVERLLIHLGRQSLPLREGIKGSVHYLDPGDLSSRTRMN